MSAAPRHRMQLSLADARFRGLVWQVLIVGTLAAIAWYLIYNTGINLRQRKIATGFEFLGRVAGIPIAETPIAYDPAASVYARALFIGVLNTLQVACIGVVLATILGTMVGIGRMSSNWLLSKLTGAYIETLRDIPVLLQLLFWYTLLQNLPLPRQAWRLGDSFFLSNRGIKVPHLIWNDAHFWSLAAFVLGIVLTIGYSALNRRHQLRTGYRRPIWPAALVLLLTVPVAVWAALGAPFMLDKPVLRGFNFVGGGTISPEFCALLIGLVIYTSAFIAEIVRAGVEGISRGQWEAGRALGLRDSRVLALIILPQALRLIVPPLTSQYLNLTKNSSLAVAIGYQEITSIAGTTLIQTGQAIEGVAIIMVVYLIISLGLSFLMNWYNARIRLVER